MMSSIYDEDVYENPFFTKITTNHPDYLEQAVQRKGVLCIPKYSIAAHIIPTQQDIEDHILFPTNEIDDDADDFTTLSRKSVQYSGGKIITKDGFEVSRQVPVLFAETFHTDNGSYRVFCVEALVNRELDKQTEKSSSKPTSPTSYHQMLELLWSNEGGQRMRESLDKVLNTFAVTYDRLEGESLRSIVDAANTQFTKAVQLLLKDSVVRKSARHNASYMENLKVAVETYMMNAVHKRLFRVITATMAAQDSELNKLTRNLVDLQLSDLGIRKIFSQNILPAKKELSQLNRYSTPVGRLFCIKRVVSALTKPPKSMNKDNIKDTVVMMTSDDLLPILIFLIIKSEIPNWMANLVYMRHFHFAKSSDDDEFGFYLASVEAALEHIRTGNIKEEIKPLKRERWNSILVTDPAETSSSSSSSSTSSPARQISHNSIIDEFFKLVQEGEEKKVEQMLERPQKTSEEIYLQLCHPLCSCDRCDKLLSTLRNNSNLVTAYTRDNRGYTALHIAAYYGQALLIDLLIKNNAVVDATDYLGLTPLHLACQRGYQNVMLLLLHFGADVMMTDNEGNSALHLSCANGHEDCVKALVFYDANLRRLNINAQNEVGDTPLHLAAKWGFENIVRTLLENGADSTVCNRKRQTAISLAQNVKVQRWLQVAAEGVDFLVFRQQLAKSPTSPRSRSSSISSNTPSTSRYSGQRPGDLHVYEPEHSSYHVQSVSLEDPAEADKRRKKEKLFKAIIEGDIQLVKFYFGLEDVAYNPNNEEEDDESLPPPSSSTLADMCHPLCQCDKCTGIQKVSRKSREQLSVNLKTSTGYCPIHMSVLHGHSDIVALLISLNADICVQNHKGLSPLHLACCTRNSLITDMLVKAGAKVDVQEMNGDTPLLIAASNGFLNGVQILVKSGASLNVTNHKGNTALHEAVKRDQGDTVTILLHAGADTRIVNKQGKLPIDLTDDPALHALIETATFKLNETKSQNSNINNQQNNALENKHQISIKELFAAFEETDLHTLQRLTASIRSFDPKASLRRTVTRDKSYPKLDVIRRSHSILSFNHGSLRKTKSVDKADPLYIYSLFQSQSLDQISNSGSASDGNLTPMGDNSKFQTFSSQLPDLFSHQMEISEKENCLQTCTKLSCENSLSNDQMPSLMGDNSQNKAVAESATEPDQHKPTANCSDFVCKGGNSSNNYNSNTVAEPEANGDNSGSANNFSTGVASHETSPRQVREHEEVPAGPSAAADHCSDGDLLCENIGVGGSRDISNELSKYNVEVSDFQASLNIKTNAGDCDEELDKGRIKGEFILESDQKSLIRIRALANGIVKSILKASIAEVSGLTPDAAVDLNSNNNCTKFFLQHSCTVEADPTPGAVPSSVPDGQVKPQTFMETCHTCPSHLQKQASLESEVLANGVEVSEQQLHNDVATTQAINDVATTQKANNDVATTQANNDVATTQKANNDVVTTQKANNDVATTQAINDVATTQKANNDVATTQANNDVATIQKANNDVVTTQKANNDVATTQAINDVATTQAMNDVATTQKANNDVATTQANNDVATIQKANNDVVTTQKANDDVAKIICDPESFFDDSDPDTSQSDEAHSHVES
ncbi:ankyrin repeat domain-containing protein 27-like [Physella acuta]|uniref:ankyrin repeat domain-containing protein 27-like n=1 Tax=Physella acuta TaxID=109671 RepID=UPI0027DD8B2B|nr:ankyrin repeat domain-containing protein 27-like [Physella acuta]